MSDAPSELPIRRSVGDDHASAASDNDENDAELNAISESEGPNANHLATSGHGQNPSSAPRLSNICHAGPAQGEFALPPRITKDYIRPYDALTTVLAEQPPANYARSNAPTPPVFWRKSTPAAGNVDRSPPGSSDARKQASEMIGYSFGSQLFSPVSEKQPRPDADISEAKSTYIERPHRVSIKDMLNEPEVQSIESSPSLLEEYGVPLVTVQELDRQSRATLGLGSTPSVAESVENDADMVYDPLDGRQPILDMDSDYEPLLESSAPAQSLLDFMAAADNAAMKVLYEAHMKRTAREVAGPLTEEKGTSAAATAASLSTTYPVAASTSATAASETATDAATIGSKRKLSFIQDSESTAGFGSVDNHVHYLSELRTPVAQKNEAAVTAAAVEAVATVNEPTIIDVRPAKRARTNIVAERVGMAVVGGVVAAAGLFAALVATAPEF